MSSVNPTAEAPPITDFDESTLSIENLVSKVNALPTGQAIRYQPVGTHRHNPDLFLIDLKQAFTGVTGKFTLLPTPNGVIIQKA